MEILNQYLIQTRGGPGLEEVHKLNPWRVCGMQCGEWLESQWEVIFTYPSVGLLDYFGFQWTQTSYVAGKSSRRGSGWVGKYRLGSGMCFFHQDPPAPALSLPTILPLNWPRAAPSTSSTSVAWVSHWWVCRAYGNSPSNSGWIRLGCQSCFTKVPLSHNTLCTPSYILIW